MTCSKILSCIYQVSSSFSVTLAGIFLLSQSHLWAAEPAAGGLKQITVPEGFTVELAAAAPLVEHPIMGGFDDRGRLYLAENAGLNLPKDQLEKQLPNSVVRLEDSNGDGIFDKKTLFADKLTFPQGAVWHQGSVYVASSGAIWKFTDTNDDGIAEERKAIVNSFGYTGNAADVHGCFVGPEGRIYWCEGRHGHKIIAPDGTLISQGKAARIFSCQTDGTDVRTHCGGGMDNPVEIDWLPSGEMLGTVNILYEKRGDCLVHWLHGGVYPRHDQPDMLAEFKKTGPPLDAVHNYGHVAVSGMTIYRSSADAFGEKYHGQVFVTEFNTRKVTATKLTREGASFKSEVTDFLTSTDPDFHPTDVIEASDGSLLVVDTGGWFRIGCPTSQIAKPDVLGAIYRIRPLGATQGTGVLVPAPAVLSTDLHLMEVYRTGWAKPAAGTPAKNAKLIEELATSPDAALKRTAATALGQRHATEAVPALLAQLSGDLDRTLEHALIYALIEIGDRSATAKGLSSPHRMVQRGALIALDQMENGNLTREEVAPLLDSGDQRLQAAAIDVVSRRAGWEQELIKLAGELLALPERTEGQQALVSGALVPFCRTGVVQELVQDQLAVEQLPVSKQLLLLEVMAHGELKELPAVWIPGLRKSLASADERIQQGALAAVNNLRGGKSLAAELVKLAAREQASASVVVETLQLLLASGEPLPPTGFAILVAQVQASDAPLLRLSAARALGSAKLEEPQLRQLAPLLATAGPMELPVLVEALKTTKDDSIGGALVRSLLANPATTSLSLGYLETLLGQFSSEVQQKGAPLLAKLRAEQGQQEARLSLLAKNFTANESKATLAAGKEVFFGRKTACYTCHRIGSEGGRIGPDLSEVGKRRNPRDLFEAILYPSQSLVRGYESHTFVLDDGRVLTGLVLRQASESLLIRQTDQVEIRVPRGEISSTTPSRTSIMPNGLDQTMTTEQLQHLVNYLYSLK